MSRTNVQESARRLSAVFFADIVGFTTLTAVDEHAAIQMVDLLQRLSRQIIERTYRGRVVKFIGDATLAEFASADGAVRAALALQQEYRKEAEAMGATGLLRIAVHLGEVIASADGDIYGDGVNMASRLEQHTRAGNVTVSEDIWRQLRSRRAFNFKALPPVELRGISGSVGIYDVTAGVEDPDSDDVQYGTSRDRRRFSRDVVTASAWRPRPNFVLAVLVAALLVGLGLVVVPGTRPMNLADAADVQQKLAAPSQTTAEPKTDAPANSSTTRRTDDKPAVKEASVISSRVRSKDDAPPSRTSRVSQSDLTGVLDDFTRSLARGDTRRMRELFPNADASSLKIPDEIPAGSGTSGEIASMKVPQIENGIATVYLVIAFKQGQSYIGTPLPYRAQLAQDGNRWVIQSFARR